MAVPTRDRIVETTSELFRRQGYPATSVKQVVEEAGAPFGSLYHHFPGGKEELAEEVIRTSGARYGDLVDLFFVPGGDPVAQTVAFFTAAGQTLVDTGYADACPIAAVALEVASTSERLRIATADVFEGWTARATAAFTAAGVGAPDARALSLTVIALLEGAFLLCRASRSTEAMDAAGVAAAAAVRAALARA